MGKSKSRMSTDARSEGRSAKRTLISIADAARLSWAAALTLECIRLAFDAHTNAQRGQGAEPQIKRGCRGQSPRIKKEKK